MRPPVAVTIGYSKDPEVGFELHTAYVRSIEKAGGLPLIVAPGGPDDAAAVLDRVSGLLLTGGSDVDPVFFGESRHPAVTRVVPERDAFEVSLCREALRRDLSLLAICRGQQILNVALDGTLYQDIATQVVGALEHRSETERWEVSHDVDLLPGSRTRAMLGTDRVEVNSFHHQAVKEVGRGLVVSARSPVDGIIEGIESPGHRFVVGVQWHPEDFIGRSAVFEPLFAALVQACGTR